MNISRDLLAAVGLVVLEATNLEWMLAGLIAARQGFSDDRRTAMLAKPGTVCELSKLANNDRDWTGLGELAKLAESLLAQRNKLVHSVVVHVRDEDDELLDLRMWHAKTTTSHPLPADSELARLASELSRCAVEAVMLIPEAEDRLARFGHADTTSPTPSV